LAHAGNQRLAGGRIIVADHIFGGRCIIIIDDQNAQ
jgi:hypothetical protein